MLNENLLVAKEKRASGRLITDCERVVGTCDHVLVGVVRIPPNQEPVRDLDDGLLCGADDDGGWLEPAATAPRVQPDREASPSQAQGSELVSECGPGSILRKPNVTKSAIGEHLQARENPGRSP
jgi:hypothetical protein